MTKKTKDELTRWLIILCLPIIFAVILGFSILIGRFFYISIPALLIWHWLTAPKDGDFTWF